MKGIQVGLIAALLCTIAAAKDTLTVVTDVWPPFRIGAEGKMTGIDLDFMTQMGKELNVVFKFEKAPWARCLYMMENGQADIMTGLAWTEERANYIHYAKKPYYTCSPAFYVLKGSGVSITRYEDLKKYSIGYARASAYFEPFNSDSSLNKVDITDEASMLKMLVHKRVQVIIGTDCQVDYDLAHSNLSSSITKALYTPESSTKLYLGISKKSPFMKRAEEFNRACEKLTAQNVPQNIAKKYFRSK